MKIGKAGSIYVAVTAFVLASLSVEAAPGAKALEPGCKWTTFENASLGVKLNFQDCKEPSMHYVLEAKGNKLEQHRPSDDRTFNGPLVLEVYSKSADQKIETAIRRKFIDTLKGSAKRNCTVARIRPPQAPGRDGVLAFQIVAKDAYKKKAADDWAKKNPEGGKPAYELCGEYGEQLEGLSYFEYHPAESKSKYAFVITGMDEPIFDRDSIVFLSGK